MKKKAVVSAVLPVVFGALIILSAGAQNAHPSIWPAHEHLIVSDENGTIAILDPVRGRVINKFSHPDWLPSGAGRPIAVDPQGNLWVVDVETKSIFVFDRLSRFLRSFTFEPVSGFKITSLVIGPRGVLFILGGASSGAVDRLYGVDPSTEKILHECDLQSLVGTTIDVGTLTCGPDAEGGSGEHVLYMTTWSTTGPDRILVIDPDDLTLVRTVQDTSGMFTSSLFSIAATPGGSLVVGDFAAGTIWVSDPTQATWNQLIMGTNLPGPFAIFCVDNGFIYAADYDTGNTWIAKIRISTGIVEERFDAGIKVSYLAFRH